MPCHFAILKRFEGLVLNGSFFLSSYGNWVDSCGILASPQ
jgi:hypothetical protein